MVDRHYFEVIWFCLALILGISLSAIGLVILYDYAVHGANLAGRITFRPGGGVLALLTSATLLAFIFKRKPLSTSLAVGLSVTAIACVAIPLVQEALFGLPEALTPFQITPLMALVSLLVAASVLATLHSRKGPLVGGVCGLLTILLGIASLLSHWIHQLQPAGLGSVPESTIVVSPLVILLGLILPGLQTLPPPHTPMVSKGLILIGVFGIAVTTVSWHAMRLQHSADMQQRAEQLAWQIKNTSVSTIEIKLALIRRLAERWLLLDGVPPEAFWNQEVNSYLRDFSDIRLFGILDQHHRPVRIKSRSLSSRFWLHRFLERSETRNWLAHTHDSHVAHISQPMKDDTGRIMSTIAVPIQLAPGQYWTVIAVIDLQQVYQALFANLTGVLEVRISWPDILVFDSAPDKAPNQALPLTKLNVNSHHDTNWQVEVFAPGNSLPAEELYLPPLILFTGLGLSFLVLLSHIFWRESEHRATKLENLNKALNFHLDRQATIFESITDAFFTLNRNWRFTYVNKRSEELLKRPRHELLGRSIWDEFPDAVGSEFESQYRHAIASGESVAFEAYYPPLETWFEVSAYPSEEGLGVYYRSVTERIEAQKRLKETMAELERSNKELRDFAFAASHDLQEPLRKIQAFSDRLLITSESLGEQDKDYLKRMQSAANRMQSLIQDLLTYSRVTTRAKPFVTCNTNQILSEVLQDMETTIARENATLETRPLPHVKGDPTQIRQVLQNLVSNAVKFHKKDKAPVVLVYSENETFEGWTLVVSDNGIGFDCRYSDKLFDPFQRLHQRQDFAGTGIGMAIVKKILDRHGATVSVDSVPDQGTTFKIRFEHG